MKSIPRPIQTGHVDLSRSQLQSPFALVQFLESGFSAIPTTMDFACTSPTTSYPLLPASRSSSSPHHKRIISSSSPTTSEHLSQQSLRPQIGSPIEMTQLKKLPERLGRTAPSSPRTDSIVLQQVQYEPRKDAVTLSSSTSEVSIPTPPLLTQQDPSALGRRMYGGATAMSRFWAYVPVLVIAMAFMFDVPGSFEGPVFPHSAGDLSDGSSLMLSLAVCGVLLSWLAGCAMLVLIGLVIHEIVAVVKVGDMPSTRTTAWKWVDLF